MRTKQILLGAATGLAVFFVPIQAADTVPPPAAGTSAESAPAPAASIEAELSALVERINAKLRAGQDTEAALAAELQEFDAMLARHAGEKTDAVAQIAMFRATLYLQVFEDHAKAETLLNQIATDFPGTETAAALPRVLARVKEEAEAARTLAALIGQPAPELHFEWASREGLKLLSDLKGKVVVLDFWATWCGPCIRSFPDVRDLSAHYAGKAVEVVGVTSLQGEVHGLSSQPINCEGDAAKEHGLMKQFIQKKNVTWTIAFSAEPVFNPAWGVRGIPFVAIVAPDGTVRHAGLHPSAPLAEKTAKIDALLAEFGIGQAAGG